MTLKTTEFEKWFGNQIWGNEDFKTCLLFAWEAAAMVQGKENTNLRAKLDEAYERAALTCEKEITGGDYHYLAVHGHHDCMAQAAVNCAAAIRALKEQEKP